MAQLRVDITGDGSKLGTALGNSKNAVKQWSGDIKNHVAGAFSVGAIAATFKSTADMIDRVEDSAGAMGRTVEEVQGLAIAASIAGKELANVEKMLNAVSAAQIEAIQNPKGKQSNAFSKMGLDNSHLQTMNELAVLERIAKFTTGKGLGETRAMTDGIFGNKDVVTLNAMKDVLADLGTFIDKNKESNNIVSNEEAIKQAQAMDKLKLSWQSLTNLSVPYMTAITQVINQIFQFLITSAKATLGTLANWMATQMTAWNSFFTGDIKTGIQMLKESFTDIPNNIQTVYDEYVHKSNAIWDGANVAKQVAEQAEAASSGPGNLGIVQPTQPKDTSLSDAANSFKAGFEAQKMNRSLDFARSGLASSGNFLGLNNTRLNDAAATLEYEEMKRQTKILDNVEKGIKAQLLIMSTMTGQNFFNDFKP